jgi:hypothetical protein
MIRMVTMDTKCCPPIVFQHLFTFLPYRRGRRLADAAARRSGTEFLPIGAAEVAPTSPSIA